MVVVVVGEQQGADVHAQLLRLGQQRRVLCDQRVAQHRRVRGHAADDEVVAVLTDTAQFRDAANRGGLIKSPVELIVGTVHLLGLPVPEKTQLVRMMIGLGQMPFDPPNVKGWAGGESWITTYTLLLRQQFMRRIVEATSVAPMDGAMMSSPGRESTLP